MPTSGQVKSRNKDFLKKMSETNIKKFYSIRQTARSCGIGRTTLQRLTDSGLIRAASIGENRYHYYSAKNIYDINTINLLSECGFTHKQLSSSDMTDEVMQSFADELQDKINILHFAMENLRDASHSNSKENIRLIKIPDLRCYSVGSNTAYSLKYMSSLVETVLGEVIHKGLKTNRYYPPFIILDNMDFMADGLMDRDYECTVCIPLDGKAMDPAVVTIPHITALSTTYKYKKDLSAERFVMLRDELERLDLVPKGKVRAEALFNPFINDEESYTNIALRISVPI